MHFKKIMSTAVPYLWGLGAAIVAFLAILVGLLTADKDPTAGVWTVAILAGLVAGALTTLQARHAAEQEREVTKATKAVHDAEERLSKEVSLAAASRIEAGEIALGMARHFDNITKSQQGKAVEQFAIYVCTMLMNCFPASHGISLVLLQPHTGPRFGLPEPSSNQVAWSVAWTSKPLDGSGAWTIKAGSKDAKAAASFFEPTSPWAEKGLIVSNAAEFPDTAGILRIPGTKESRSYARIPLSLELPSAETLPLGVLCVDSKETGAISTAVYDQYIEPYSTILLLGYSVYDASTGMMIGAESASTRAPLAGLDGESDQDKGSQPPNEQAGRL